MIIQMRATSNKEDIDRVVNKVRSYGCEVSPIQGKNILVLAVIGDTSKLTVEDFEEMKNVDKVLRIQEPYKKANRKSQPEDTVIEVAGLKIGGGTFTVMAGPCSVESEDQVVSIAEDIKASGAQILRGGAFKPRTSPYAFQGMGVAGLEILKTAREKTGLPIVTEIMSADMIETFVKDVDIIQVGARNMQNFPLLKELGKIDKPILLKRGLSATIKEWIMSAEYIMSEGNNKVILCERGIRTYETYTRNTLDLSAIPAIKQLTHLPVIVDPSHATGKWWMVEPLAKAAAIIGADGLMIEVHNDPECALCDGPQSLKPKKFDNLMGEIKKILPLTGKTLK